MAPITALLNSNVSSDKGIQVFYVTDEDNLGVSLKNAGAKGKDASTFYEADKSAGKGLIPVKSEIGSATLDGLDLVVAVTKRKPEPPCDCDKDKPTQNNVSIVSPVYQVLAQTSVQNTTAAITSNTDNSNAWVYYLSGTNTGAISIIEYELTTGNSTPINNLNIDPDCSLGAYFDDITGQRSVVYQDKEQKKLREYNVDTQQTANIKATAGAKANTSLGVTSYKGAVYLYYTDEYFNLYRVTKDSKGWSNNNIALSGAGVIDEASQISAVGSDDKVHVFYQVKGNKNITHTRDDLVKAQ